jgi:hypothetical protein
MPDTTKHGEPFHVPRHQESPCSSKPDHFVSGTISTRMKLTVESVRNEQGERVYRVK